MKGRAGRSVRLTVWSVLMAVLAAAFLVSAVMVTVTLVRYRREAAELDALAKSLPEREPAVIPAPSPPPQESAAPDTPEDPPHIESEELVPQEPETPPEPEILPRYEELYAQNPELFGWIEIPGTLINYPVMHTPDDPEKYLHADFDGEYSFSGIPFMDADCFPDCGNYLLYGHDMKNKTMFTAILGYRRKSFWTEHPTIYFDTLTQPGEYQVVAAFYDKVHQQDENVFKYYKCTDLTDEEDFNYYVSNVMSMALYDTGIDVAWGDSLLTLSTCSYQTDNGRFVVVAKRVTEAEEPPAEAPDSSPSANG